MDLKDINELTGKILSVQSKVFSLNYCITYLKKEPKEYHFRATVNIQYGMNRRSNFNEELTREELISMLEKRLLERENELQQLKLKYENQQK